jgi:hypothetical protein
MTRLALPLAHGADEVVLATRRLARRLRMWRHRRRHRYRPLRFCGVTMGATCHILVAHPSMSKDKLGYAFQGWLGMTLVDDLAALPPDELAVEDIVALASNGRGIEPLRFYIGPASTTDNFAGLTRSPQHCEPMPVLIG